MAIRIFDQTVGQTAGIPIVTTGKGLITNDGLEAYAQMVVSASGSGLTGDAAGEGNIVSVTGATIADGTITLNANTESVVIDTQGFENVSLTVSGFGTATIQVQWSNLPSSGFVASDVTDINTGTSSATITADGQYTAPAGGRYLRIITTAYTSGTLLVTPTFYAGGGSGGGSGGGVSEGHVTTASPAYVDGTDEPLSLDEHGALRVLANDTAGAPIDWTAPVSVFGTGTAGSPGSGAGAATTGVLTIQGAEADDAAAVSYPVPVGGVYTSALPTLTNNDRAAFRFTSNGLLLVGGAVADAATAAGNPLPVGGVYVSTAPTYTTGQRTTLQQNPKGGLIIGGFAADDAAAPAAADTYPAVVGGIYRATLPTYTDGDRTQAHFNLRGQIIVGGAVAENDPSGADNVTYPVITGADYNSTFPTYADGDRTALQAGSRGALRVQLTAPDSPSNVSVVTFADGVSASVGVAVWAAPALFDGTNFDRGRSIAGTFGSSDGVAAVEQAGSPFAYISGAATTQVKSGAGILHAIIVNTSVAAATISVIDNTSGSTVNIALITLTAIEPHCLIYNLSFATGLRIITSGATDITVIYR